MSPEGSHEFGPLSTLASAKEYVNTGSVLLGQHNPASSHGQRQSKKEYNAHIAAEAKQGNYGPLILSLVVMGIVALVIELAKNG